MAAERMIFDRSRAAYAKEQIMQKSKVRKTTGKTAIYTNKHQEIQCFKCQPRRVRFFCFLAPPLERYEFARVVALASAPSPRAPSMRCSLNPSKLKEIPNHFG